MHAALTQRRASPQQEEEERRGRGGHAAKAGFRGTTMIIVVLGILATLYVLKLSSKALELRPEPKRPGASQGR
jgi:hypothetical protein